MIYNALIFVLCMFLSFLVVYVGEFMYQHQL